MMPLARKLREGAAAEDIAAFLDAAESQMGFGEISRNAATRRTLRVARAAHTGSRLDAATAADMCGRGSLP